MQQSRIIDATALKAALTAPAGRPQLLDVRQPAEYQEGHLPGATLIPLPELGERLAELDRSRPVVTYCHSGKRSLAAAEHLAGQGFDAATLAGGMLGWEGQAAVGDAAQGLAFFPAGAAPLAVLALAWAMEDNLGRFYAGLARKAADPRLRDLFDRLHRFEESHKAMVFRLARLLDPALPEAAALAAHLPAGTATGALEGGLSAEEFLARNADSLESRDWVVDAAMAFEAQALDLYTRLASHLANPQAQAQARALAEEERRHLKALGNLLDALG